MADLHESPQLAQSPVSSSKHCADWTIQGAGDVHKGHIGKMAKQQYLSVGFGQPSQRHLKRVHVLLKIQRVKRSGGFARKLIRQLNPLAAGFDHRRLRRVPGQVTTVIPNQIHQDPEQPGFELSLIIIAPNALDNPQKSFLNQILRQFRFVSSTQRVSK